MIRKNVLMIGLEPTNLDFSAFPGLDAEKVLAGIQGQQEYLRGLGYDMDVCLTDTGETAEAVATDALKQKHYDCVVIGAGVRVPPVHFLLFERLINVVHAHAPDARIAFNTKPTDNAEAVQRWI
jgi:DNA-binding LacI/PurR family transcriptional regulator